ncbi:MAG: YihY/virulence factor BrkB family protein, partial [Bacteroidales bacterium]
YDISDLSVGMLLNKIDNTGTGEKAFRINRNSKYREQWNALADARKEMYKASSQILIKDLEIGEI